MKPCSDKSLLSIEEAGSVMGISRSTVWRMIRRGSIPSIRSGGRRMIPKQTLQARNTVKGARAIPPLTEDHPIFRLAGAGRGGGNAPGARDKHAILDK